jgi:two-component system response regulator AdeR
MDNALILVVEDEAEIASILEAYLVREGFRTVRAADGVTALEHHLRLKPDLVLLDVKLPKADGFQVLSELRRRDDTPVIMVTAMEEDLDKLSALRLGADDYVVKPFNPIEVVARCKAVLRRTAGRPEERMLRYGPIEVDLPGHAARFVGDNQTALELTLTEFRLLAHMIRAPTRVFTRGELVDACLPEGEALERTVDSHVSNLRRKLGAGGWADSLQGVRGVGYRLSAG